MLSFAKTGESKLETELIVCNLHDDLSAIYFTPPPPPLPPINALLNTMCDPARALVLTHCGPVTQICVFTLQLCKTDDANLRF